MRRRAYLDSGNPCREFRRRTVLALAAYAGVDASLEFDAAAAHRGLAGSLRLGFTPRAAVRPPPIEGLVHQHARKAHSANVVSDDPALHRLAH